MPLIFLLPSYPRSPCCGPETTLCESRIPVAGSDPHQLEAHPCRQAWHPQHAEIQRFQDREGIVGALDQVHEGGRHHVLARAHEDRLHGAVPSGRTPGERAADDPGTGAGEIA